MSPAAALAAGLEARGVQLRVEGGRLLAQAPPGALTADDRAAVKRLKPDLLRLLASPGPLPGSNIRGVPASASCTSPRPAAGPTLCARCGDPVPWGLKDYSLATADGLFWHGPCFEAADLERRQRHAQAAVAPELADDPAELTLRGENEG